MSTADTLSFQRDYLRDRLKRAQYLLRFDDICPTMNWDIWPGIEVTLDARGIKPIVAVIPDNRDPKLKFGPPDSAFWRVVRKWQQKGWVIAMHGHQHVYTTRNCGIIRMQSRSEFAGLSRDEQQRKLRQAIQIFRNEGITPSMWVAPSHSFDWTTVGVLRELGVRIISDGLSQFPYRDSTGMFWIPQQIWRLRSAPAGTWTVCYHHNEWGQEQLARFCADVQRFRDQIVNPAEVCKLYENRRKTLSDEFCSVALYGYVRGTGYWDRLRSLLTRRFPHLGCQ